MSSKSSLKTKIGIPPAVVAVGDVERLRRALAEAKTIAEVKRVHDLAAAMAKEAAAAKDFVLLDAATAVRFAATHKGGAMLLAGAERVAGIEAETWRKRAEMDDRDFALRVRKAQTMARRNTGEPQAPRKATSGGRTEPLPQAKTLFSPWRVEEGFPTRFIVGVDMMRWREMIAAGGDVKKIEAKLIAEVVDCCNLGSTAPW
jgi:hypothetical protein